jgi:hypothetical protein
MKLETKILKHLLANEDYARKTLPFLKAEYFNESEEKLVFEQVHNYITKYNDLPTISAIKIEIENKPNIVDSLYKKTLSVLTEIDSVECDHKETQWLVESTEKFCQEKAIYNGIMQSIQILDDKTGTSKLDKGAIPTILADALSVSFDNHVGHDFLDDAESRYEFYHKVEQRIPFDLDYFNKITKGGLPNKTLNIILAGCVHPETKVKIRFRKKV